MSKAEAETEGGVELERVRFAWLRKDQLNWLDMEVARQKVALRDGEGLDVQISRWSIVRDALDAYMAAAK